MAAHPRSTLFDGALVVRNPALTDGEVLGVANVVIPGGTVVWQFTNSPPDTSDVWILVTESIYFHGGAHGAAYGPDYNGSDGPHRDRLHAELAHMKGRTERGRLQAVALVRTPRWADARLDFRHKWLKDNFIWVTIGDLSLKVWLEQAHWVYRHLLFVQVAARGPDADWRWTDRAAVHVEYPVSLVVPHSDYDYRADPLLYWGERWAKQWQEERPLTRKVVLVPVQSSAPPSVCAHRRTIQKIVEAARFASSGTVAVATGHGAISDRNISAQDHSEETWFNYVPEYVRPGTSALRVKPGALLDGSTGLLPQSDARAKLLAALDWLGHELASTPLRSLVFYTCRIGRDQDFMQLLADRAQVPVTAQRMRVGFDPTPEDWPASSDNPLYTRYVYRRQLDGAGGETYPHPAVVPRDYSWLLMAELSEPAFPDENSVSGRYRRYWKPHGEAPSPCERPCPAAADGSDCGAMHGSLP